LHRFYKMFRMKKIVLKEIVTLLACFLFSIPVFSQSADIAYKEKWRNQFAATFYFSDGDGLEEVDTAAFRSNEQVCFTVIPNAASEKEYFKDDDISTCFAQFKLLQNGSLIENNQTPHGIHNGEGKIDKVVLFFPKSEITLYEPLAVVSMIDTSDVILISDKYYNQYHSYFPAYQEAAELSDQRRYIETYKAVLPIVKDAQDEQEIKHYTFYDHAASTLVTNAIIQHIDSLSQQMTIAGAAIKANADETKLQTIDSLYALMQSGEQAFSSYFEMGEPQSMKCREEYTVMLDNAKATSAAAHELYKDKVLHFLENKGYNDYKFRLFVDALAKMVSHLDTLKILRDPVEINFALLDEMPDLKNELMMSNALEEFRLLVTMLNDDIRNKNKVFNTRIIENLQRIKPAEHEPYLLIFLAFNELANNKSLFLSYLIDALKYCSDETLVLNIEMWILSNNATLENLSESIIHQINQGIKMVINENWTEAEATFSAITRQAGTIAPPWFYLGKTQFKQEETFAAESKFDRALNIYPQYIAPRIFKFQIYLKQEKYDDLLTMVEDALETNDIWIFHYYKAVALNKMNKYQSAINELQQYCITINKYNIPQYFMLGDCFRELKKYELAKDAYQQTQSIDIYASEESYNKKMQILEEARN